MPDTPRQKNLEFADTLFFSKSLILEVLQKNPDKVPFVGEACRGVPGRIGNNLILNGLLEYEMSRHAKKALCPTQLLSPEKAVSAGWRRFGGVIEIPPAAEPQRPDRGHRDKGDSKVTCERNDDRRRRKQPSEALGPSAFMQQLLLKRRPRRLTCPAELFHIKRL